MIYIRGNKRDYDQWEALGNTGWSYEQVLPYFLKSEDNRNPYLARTPYHATGGYLTVQEAPWRTPLSIAFLQAGRELGYQVRDLNGAKQTGFMLAQGTIRRGSRLVINTEKSSLLCLFVTEVNLVGFEFNTKTVSGNKTLEISIIWIDF